MRVALVGIGSRGDVQPLMALGQGLRAAGHEVVMIAGNNFEQDILRAGLIPSLTQIDVQALVNTEVGQDWMEKSSHNLISEGLTMRRMVESIDAYASEIERTIPKDADVVISGVTSFALVDAFAQHHQMKHIIGLFAPFNPTASHAATLVPFPKIDIPTNRIAAYSALYFTYWVFQRGINEFRAFYGMPPLSFWGYLRRFLDLPTLYAVSPQVLPRPKDWPDHVFISGYWFHHEDDTWQPPAALSAFLAQGPPPVYIGFGSMGNKNPESTAQMMVDALKQSGQRGLIHRGWAGLVAEDIPEDVFLLDYVPHHWLFPRTAGVIHHGGAGTTAAALRAGVPSAVIAHIADQPYWGRRVHDLGVGLPFVRRHKLTAGRLAQIITGLVQDEPMRQRAAALGQLIRQEDGVTKAVGYIERVVAGEKLTG